MTQETEMSEYYQSYYHQKGSNRNDLSSNRGVLFQTLALEASVVRASSDLRQNPVTAKVLDVGCGGGGNLFQLLRLNYQPENISGIDIQDERLAEARRLYPQTQQPKVLRQVRIALLSYGPRPFSSFFISASAFRLR